MNEACPPSALPARNLVASRHVRAPAENGGLLIEPPLSEVPTLLAANAACRGRCDYDFSGRSLGQLAAQSRTDLVREAVRYTSQYRDVGSLGSSGRIFLAGHQPQLFHPGVWFKNFALGRLAAVYDAVAVNLVIDSDTIKGASLRVPGGSLAAPVVQGVVFDEASAEIPYQERTILNRDLWDSFGTRASQVIAPLVREPLLRQYWPLVQERARQTTNLGECLAQARHQLEGTWGLSTLEFPQSRVCQLPSFSWFVAHLLAHLPRFREIYNASVAEYRRTYHLRSANHPVPDLAEDGGWLEAPFWLWTAESPKRRRLFARQRAGELLITDRRGLEIALPLGSSGDLSAAAAALTELASRGIRLRTRALLTTLFARLMLSDLFLHGIGGGKYDELTDVLIERFFGFEAPRFQVLSATLRLPIEHANVSVEDVARIDHQLRELVFHPERHLEASGDETSEATIAKKWAWIRTPVTRANVRQRCHEIRRANEALQPLVERRRQQLLKERQEIVGQLRGAAVWASREYAFCLYPEQTLRDFMLAFHAPGP